MTNTMSQIDTFENMLKNGHDSEMLRYTLGGAYFKEQKYEMAIEHLRHATTLKEDYSAAWRLLGRALAANDQVDEAREAFNEGERVASANGDVQALKEINVFRKRLDKKTQS